MKFLLLSSSLINFITLLLNFLFKIYLAHHISQKDIGLFYTFIDTINLGIILLAGFKDSLIVSFDKYKKDEVLYIYIISFLFFCLIVFIIDFFAFYQLKSDIKIIFYFILLFLQIIALFLSYLNAALKNYKMVMFENFIMSIIFIIVVFFYTTFNGMIIGIILAYILRIFYLLKFSKKDFKIKKTSLLKYKNFLKNTFISSLMYFFSGFFITSAGLILLNLYNNPQELSNYQVVIRSIFFALVTIFVFPLNSLLFMKISKLIHTKNFERLKKIEKKFFIFLVIFYIIIIAIMIVDKYVIFFLFPKEYHSSYEELNILLPFLPFIAYTTFAINFLKGFDRFDLALIVRIFGNIIFFISIFIFYIFKFDFYSIYYSFDLAFFAMGILSFIFKRRLSEYFIYSSYSK